MSLRRPQKLSAASIALAVVAVVLLAGCQRYERVVARSSILSGLEGSDSQIPEKQSKHAVHEIFSTPTGEIRVENELGEITLYAKNVRQLMTHITTTIQNEERDLFIDQVLSKVTKDEFTQRGLDPALAFEELTKHQREIFRLFYFMPMGEYTPGLHLKAVGFNTFRLQLSRARNESLYWIGIDSVFENGNYRLRWFVP